MRTVQRLMLISSLLGLALIVLGQGTKKDFGPLYPYTKVKLFEAGLELANPWTGGMNRALVSPIDLDHDSLMDLYLFDKAGNVHMAFRNTGKFDSIAYKYQPAYTSAFPAAKTFSYMRDFNCDGLSDMLTRYGANIRVFLGDTSNGQFSFSFLTNKIEYKTASSWTNVFVGNDDAPGLADVDGDGDMDILAYDLFYPEVNWYKNLSADSGWSCDNYYFVKDSKCWGNFLDDAGTGKNSVSLVSCKTSKRPKKRHSGSSLCLIDNDQDGDKDLLLGATGYSNMVYLHNGGSATYADMVHYDDTWPSYTTRLDMQDYPVPFALDVSNDGWDDVVISANETFGAIDADNLWMYQSNKDSSFSFVPNGFLVDGTFDLGSGAYPAIFDYNGDSLPDLLVGNYSRLTDGDTIQTARLALLVNVGTAEFPNFHLVDEDYLSLSLRKVYHLSPTTGDIDFDGDLDLILGRHDGFVDLFENITSGDTADLILRKVQYAGLDVGENSAPFLYDHDLDMDLDLFIGNRDGKIEFFENMGDSAKPVFNTSNAYDNVGGIHLNNIFTNNGNAQPWIGTYDTTGIPYLFIGGDDGRIHVHEFKVDSIYTAPMYVLDTLGGLREGLNASPLIHDLNHDGKPDLIVGNYRGGLAIYSSILVDTLDRPIEPPPPPPIDTTDTINDTISIGRPIRTGQSVQIYPNPTDDWLSIDASREMPFHLEIYDMLGRNWPIGHWIDEGSSARLSVGHLADGVYFLRAEWPDDKQIIRFIKQSTTR